MIPLRVNVPRRTVPFMTVGLILVNVGIFIYQLLLGPGEEEFVTRYAAIPVEVLHWGSFDHSVPVPYTLVSAMFLHGGFLHIGGNMLFLWIFGHNVEDYFGHLKFILFYALCGIVATAVFVASAPDSPIPMIGASGAISGILGAFFLLYPTASVETLVFIFFFVTVWKLPAFLFLGLWFLLQVFNAPLGGGVAWYAHIGGFVAGFAITIISYRRQARRRTRRFD